MVLQLIVLNATIFFSCFIDLFIINYFIKNYNILQICMNMNLKNILNLISIN